MSNSAAFLLDLAGKVMDIDMMKHNKINKLFNWASTPNEPECRGIVAILDNALIGSWCSRLQPMDKYYEIYMDYNRAIIYFDCGCHYQKHLSNQAIIHQDHSSFKQCNNYIHNLLKCAFIGLQKTITQKDVHPTNICCTFHQSIFFDNTLKCKNCIIILSIKLSQLIVEHFGSSSKQINGTYYPNIKKFYQASIFSRMISIYVFSKLLNHSLSSFHTAGFWLSDQQYTPLRAKHALLSFINVAAAVICTFHQTMAENDRGDAIIFRVVSDSFNDLLRTFLKRYNRIKHSEWLNGMKTTVVGMKSAEDELRYRIDKTCAYLRGQDMKQILNEKAVTLKNVIWKYVHYDKELLFERDAFYYSLCFEEMYLDEHESFAIFTKMAKHSKLKLKSVECQWKPCHKKNDYKKNGRKFKKCKGCKLVRYCGTKCQKFDWNKGYHNQMCKHIRSFIQLF
eukprot:295430_1